MQIDSFYIDTLNKINEKDIINSTVLYYDQIIGKIKEIKLIEEFISGKTWSVLLDITTTDKNLIKEFKEDKEKNGYYYKF